ncbi:MAG TPA: dicarboxylate/amino acid:cation symporter [Gemmatimonadaceae bacterium]
MRRLHKNLTVQVLVAISLGALLGFVAPDVGKQMKPIGDTFVNLVKMVIAPVVFLTIVLGIANMHDLKKVGRVGGKALLYFEIVTTFALVIGLFIVNVVKPGHGLATASMAKPDVSSFVTQGKAMSFVDFMTHIVPSSFIDPFVRGEMIQVVFIAVLFGASLAMLGELGRPLTNVLEITSRVFFKIVGIVMVVAPIGAFGAMAYTIGAFGIGALLPLGRLMLSVYITMAVFIFVVLNAILRFYGFSLWQYIKFIREEILIVLGTSSSEAALPRMLAKMERYGCSKPVVGLVIPAGYSFNLDGTSIYLSMAAIFIAQAFNVQLTPLHQIELLGVLMITSKGAAGVTGSGFIVLASTLSAMKVVPVEGIALVLGVDRFMSEARAITNLIGNGAATLVVARSENAFSEEQRRIAVAELHEERIAARSAPVKAPSERKREAEPERVDIVR